MTRCHETHPSTTFRPPPSTTANNAIKTTPKRGGLLLGYNPWISGTRLKAQALNGYVRYPDVRLIDYNDEWSDDEFSYLEYDEEEAYTKLLDILGENPTLFYTSGH